MAASKKFEHRGVTVLLYDKSFRLTGMHDTVFLGKSPDEQMIRRLIDAIQGAAKPQAGDPCTSGPVPEALDAALSFSCVVVAFLGRDRGTDRLERTLDDIVKEAISVEHKARAAVRLIRSRPSPRTLRERFLHWWYKL